MCPQLNAERLTTVREQPEGLALAREPEEYSKKFRYTSAASSACWRKPGG